MINLFNIENYTIDTSKFDHVLHDSGVIEFEHKFAQFVGAKYACGVNSATSAIYLAMSAMSKNGGEVYNITIPTMIPPVVANAIITSGNRISFYDNVKWVGDSYVLHEFEDYKIIDSAQQLYKDQFAIEANDNDLMIFSFYPTKPVGSIDGGMIVSNDKDKIEWFRQATLNGMGFAKDNWHREIKFPGWKMYMNSIQAYVANKNFDIYEEKLEKLNTIRETYNSTFGLKNTSNHLYRIEVEDNVKAMEKLKSKGIISGIHYSCLHKIPTYRQRETLVNSERLESKTLSIPFHEKLEPRDTLAIKSAVMELI
tara:strand:+ start:424 stop:1356 length:933 start_codon:yes stop_codon:yes gene_type:complete